jgi:predicted transcriptional regulator
MADLGWSTSDAMQEHLQNLISQGYMTAMKLATYRVPEDPASPILVGDTSSLKDA